MTIYKITNTVNGKVYIGQTRQALSVRWRQHGYNKSNCSLLRRAIEKYGVEAFRVEALCTAETQEDLDRKEAEFIASFNAMSPAGYNLTSGGEGGYVRSEETRARLSAAGKGKGRPHTPESKAKLSAGKTGDKNPMFGRKQSEETKRKRSQALKGRPRAPEVIEAIRAHHNPKSDLNLRRKGAMQ